MKKLFFALLLVSSVSVFAQNGTIRGTVYEEESGQTAIGANVVVVNPLTGTSTDLDGKYSISIAPGTYDIKVSYISFQTQHIKGVVVKSGEVTVLDDVYLKSAAMELGVVEVTATATRKSEAALNMMKKKSVAMMDGISAEKMELTGDASAVDAAKRVTGVSIEGGKYVYVRGLGDRYSKVTLNQVDIPGLDPDKNSLQMDLIPTNLIDNIVVSKNFTADMPADFTGGLMNVETKAFPDSKFMEFSVGTSYNPSMHFNNDYLTYDGGNTDFLGYDDGTRALPRYSNSINMPSPSSGHSNEQVNEFVRSFNPTLGAERKTSLMDYSMSFSYGDQKQLAKNNESSWGKKNPTLGYIFSIAYKTDYKYYDDVTYGEYQRPTESSDYELVQANLKTGEQSSQSVLVGAMAGLAYKTTLSKIRLTAMHLQNGESRSGKFFVENSESAVGQSGFIASSNNLEYNERSLSNVLLHGQHLTEDRKWEIDWRVSPTYSTSYDPDIRSTGFTYTPIDTFFSAGAGGNPSRIWRSLEEVNLTAKADITYNYELFEEDAKLKFGSSFNYKDRNYEILKYDMQFEWNQDWNSDDPNQALDPSVIFPNQPNGSYYYNSNPFLNPNAYESSVQNIAAYVSQEMSLSPRLKTILGVRMESFTQWHTGRDQAYAQAFEQALSSGGDLRNIQAGNSLNDEVVLESVDFFPSVNVIYNLTEDQNLRFAYSKTIARPSFKELSFAQIIDPLTNRYFNGAFFEYEDWDGNLVETRIDNLDFRWEKFMERGQIVSASVFYKSFDSPIELVRIPEQQTTAEYQPRNVGNASLVGIELEATKGMEFISEKLADFSFSGNVTLVRSQVDMTDREFNARKNYEKDGQNIDDRRPMAGQAPYVINAGITYKNVEKAFQAGLFYNVKGPALQIVGTGLYPDVYQEPFHSLNLGVNKKLGEEGNTTIDFKVSNLLGDRVESFFQSYEADKQVFSSFNPGRAFSIGVSHKF